MTMNDFRRLAAKIDQHMQQLAAEGVREPDAIMTRMIGYVPELHNIWVGASDQQLIALSRDFPGFYRFAGIMEKRSKPSAARPRVPMTARPSSPNSTSKWARNC